MARQHPPRNVKYAEIRKSPLVFGGSSMRISHINQIVFSTADVLILFGISRSTLVRWVNGHVIPPPKIVNKRRYWTRSDLDKFCRQKFETSLDDHIREGKS